MYVKSDYSKYKNLKNKIKNSAMLVSYAQKVIFSNSVLYLFIYVFITANG